MDRNDVSYIMFYMVAAMMENEYEVDRLGYEEAAVRAYDIMQKGLEEYNKGEEGYDCILPIARKELNKQLKRKEV